MGTQLLLRNPYVVSFQLKTLICNLTQRDWTALHIASWEGHLPVVDELLKNKADPNIRSKVWQWPGDVA